ncbi:MAG: type VI secretion system protein TssA [Desulfobacteraceae bacterium]|nr:type VI secretion system protein TssA [Desulfobacteraceae bacterium]
MQDARRSDDPSIPQGIWERDLKKADWKNVRKLCWEILETRSKDLQIAVWLTESLLHLHAFAGLAQGLKLLMGLCEQFWDSLYPEISEEDIEARISPIIWMNEKLSLKLKLISLTMPQKTPDAVSYSFADWENAEKLEKLASKDKKLYDRAVSDGKVTRAKFLGSVMFTPAEFYRKQSEALSSCLSFSDALCRLLDARCGKQSPSLKQFIDILSDIRTLSDMFLEEKNGKETPEDTAFSEDTEISEENDAPKAKISSVTIRNRADAYRILSAVADYLLIHEPHSPTPYLVNRAVSWGNMTLTELLQELVQEESKLRQIFQLLGLKGPSTQ